jgi:magnesium transporter
VSARWIDLLDPTTDELIAVLPPVDPDVLETLAAPSGEHEPRPFVEGHGSYVVGVFVAMSADGRAVQHQEIDVVATPDLLVTVRKTPPGGVAYDPAAMVPAANADERVGVLLHRLVDDVADSYLGLLDEMNTAIDDLEERIDTSRLAEVRVGLSELRNELLRRRLSVSATRAAVRRILDGRVDVGEHALFPQRVERLFADTYDTLVRVTEELDVARDLLSGVRDHLQAKVAENQNEVGKKLTVIASLVLVPSFVVGFFGQNFESEFEREYWTLAFSTGVIVLSTLVQLALFRWRRWI